jgi:phage-related protein
MSGPEKKLQARFYATASGRKPVRDWLLDLSDGDRLRIGKDIQKVEFGWPIGMPYCRPLGRGLWEVRSDLDGNRIGRTFFCLVSGEMVLLHGFVKKSQATPKQDLDLARDRMKEIEQ